jgi:hypothetical protein
MNSIYAGMYAYLHLRPSTASLILQCVLTTNSNASESFFARAFISWRKMYSSTSDFNYRLEIRDARELDEYLHEPNLPYHSAVVQYVTPNWVHTEVQWVTTYCVRQ